MDASMAVQRAEKIYNDITQELGRADVSIKVSKVLFWLGGKEESKKRT